MLNGDQQQNNSPLSWILTIKYARRLIYAQLCGEWEKFW